MDSTTDETLECEAVIAVTALVAGSLNTEQQLSELAVIERLHNSQDAFGRSLRLIESTSWPDAAHALGLYTLENAVEKRWNVLSPEGKVSVKNACVRTLCSGAALSGCERASESMMFPADSAASNWPQTCVDFLTDLKRMYKTGADATLAVTILLRLAEDIDSVEDFEKERKVLRLLKSDLGPVVIALVDTLAGCTSSPSPWEDDSAARSCLTSLCLKALRYYTQWTYGRHTMAGDGRVLSVFLKLLADYSSVALPAAQVLEQVLSRGGKLQDRLPLLKLFDAHVASALSATVDDWRRRSESAPSCVTSSAVLQSLVGAACGALSALNFCCGRPGDRAITVHEPPAVGFQLVTRTLLQLPSQCPAADSVLGVWRPLLRNPAICQPALMRQLLPPLLDRVSQLVDNFLRQLQAEQQAEQTWNIRWSAAQLPDEGGLVETLGLMTSAAPEIMIDLIKRKIGILYAPLPHDCSMFEMWKTVCFLADGAFWRPFAISSVPRKSLRAGGALLSSCLQRTAQAAASPTIYCQHMSLLLALSAFLPYRLDLTASLLDALLAGVQWRQQDASGAVAVRRTACTRLLTLAERHGVVLWAGFDDLRHRVLTVLAGPLGDDERVALCEMLVEVQVRGGSADSTADYEQRSELVEQLILLWKPTADALTPIMLSPQEFTVATALNSQPTPSQVGVGGDRLALLTRARLRSFLSLLSGVLSRSRPSSWFPTDALRHSGLVASREPDLVHNPCSPHVTDHVAHVFRLIHTLHELYDGSMDLRRWPELPYIGRTCEPFSYPYLSQQIIAPVHQCGDTAGSHHVQSWLTELHWLALEVVRNAVDVMGDDLFRLPNICTMFSDCMMNKLDLLSDTWTIQMTRCCRWFVYLCPCDHWHDVLFPLVDRLCCHLAVRLDNRWRHQQYQRSSVADDDDRQQICLLTERESAQLVRLVMTTDGRCRPPPLSQFSLIMEESGLNFTAPTTPGQLGLEALQCNRLVSSLLLLLLRIMGWGDESSASKACCMTATLIVSLDPSALHDRMVGLIFSRVLHVFEVHRSFRDYMSALDIFIQLRPAFPRVLDQVLLRVPGATPESVSRMCGEMDDFADGSDRFLDRRRAVLEDFLSPLCDRDADDAVFASQLDADKVELHDSRNMFQFAQV